MLRKGEKVGTLLVSTGKAEKNRLYQETSAGCFLTGCHRVNFSTNGKKYDYVIQYDGGNLLHQIPYDWGQNKKDFTNGRGYLGAKASHACIRIQAEPDENGLNAYWLFTHLPYHTRVIILDDPQEREATKEQLSRPENSKFDPSILHITDHYGTESENQVQLTFGGNVIPGGSNGFNNRNESMSSFAEKNGYELPLKKISVLFRDDDLTCVNLCGFFQGSTAAEPSNKGIPYASAGMEAIFGNSSIELVSISQESLYSDGTEHIRNTAVALESYTKAIEQDQTDVKELKGHLIGFACCNESGYLSDPSVIDRLVSSLKDEQCEKIVFLISWKDNRDKSHRIIQEAMAHRCVRAGADLIIGYGQETIQGADYIEGVPVIYSLGTLLDGSTFSAPKNNMGLVIKAIFSFSNDCDPVSVTAVPINAYGNSNNGQNNYCPTADIPETDFSKAIQAFWNDTTDLVMNRLSFYYAGQS